MSQSYRLRLTRAALKMRVTARIPATLSVTSPLTLVKTGSEYAFGLDVSTLQASLDPLYQPVDQTLTGLAGLDSSAGIVVQTAADTFTKRTLQAPAAGMTITNPAGTAGDPTLVLANDLAAVEGLATTGIVRRTGTDTWTAGTAVANSELATAAAYTIKGNATGSSSTPTDIDIAALTTKGSPASGDYVLLSDQAASGALKKATVTSLAGSSGVSSIASNTGAFTLSTGITNSTNDIKLSLTNATLNATPSNPTNTSSTTAVMCGFGVTTCRITPVYSSRLRVTFTGTWSNNTNDRLNTLDMRYGTGTGPSVNSAVSGTQIGGPIEWSNNTADYKASFSVEAIITGLTPGVAVWLDISRFTSANTLSMFNARCVAEEF